MKKRIFGCFWILLISVFVLPSCRKQDNASGQILEYGTDQPIANATLTLRSCDGEVLGNFDCNDVANTTSDADGNFKFDRDGTVISGEAPQYFSSGDDFAFINREKGKAVPVLIHLYPHAWLKVHLKNESGAYQISAPGELLTSNQRSFFLDIGKDTTFYLFRRGIWWMAAVVTALGTSFQLSAQTWWTTRGDWTSDLKSERKALFDSMQSLFQGAIHVFDRGFCGAPWLTELFASKADFVMRWNSTYYLADLQGSRKKAWQIAHGKKPKGQKIIWDAVRKKHRSIKILYFPIRHPSFPNQKLYLVISRPGKGMKSWYLITNIKVKSVRSATFIIQTYAKRWEIETMFRYMKSEFGVQSIRLWFWENRLKLLGILSVVVAFMLDRL